MDFGEDVPEISPEAEGIEAAGDGMGEPAHPAGEEAVPLRTKMPAPIMAPTPIRVASMRVISRARRTSELNFFSSNRASFLKDRL